MIYIPSLSRVFAMATLIVVTGTLAQPLAEACKDCAFPLRVESGKWVMPNGRTQIEIYEDSQNGSSLRVTVLLRDTKTKEFLARGETTRLNFKNNFTIELEDVGHKAVLGQIRWVDKRKDIIQAKFTCVSQCVIQPYLD